MQNRTMSVNRLMGRVYHYISCLYRISEKPRRPLPGRALDFLPPLTYIMPMKERTYRKIADRIGSSAFLTAFVNWSNRIATTSIYLLYPALLVYLLIHRDSTPLFEGFVPALLIPGISFVLLSIFRDKVNAPRPYEVFEIQPVINKKTSGHSFPSRHIFSVFVIATTVFYFFHCAGLIIGVVGIILAATRILGGVHFIKDVAAGAVCGIAAGIIGFYIILPLL